MESYNPEKSTGSEVLILEHTLYKLGIDINETEKVVEQAVLLFGEGRPEHEVEVIVESLFKKIAEAEQQADSLVAWKYPVLRHGVF